MRVLRWFQFVVVAVLFLPATALAQASITGIVSNSSIRRISRI